MSPPRCPVCPLPDVPSLCPVCPQWTYLEVDVEEVPGDALDGVVHGEDVHALAVRHVRARGDGDHVAQLHPEVLADALEEERGGGVSGGC